MVLRLFLVSSFEVGNQPELVRFHQYIAQHVQIAFVEDEFFYVQSIGYEVHHFRVLLASGVLSPEKSEILKSDNLKV